MIKGANFWSFTTLLAICVIGVHSQWDRYRSVPPGGFGDYGPRPKTYIPGIYGSEEFVAWGTKRIPSKTNFRSTPPGGFGKYGPAGGRKSPYEIIDDSGLGRGKPNKPYIGINPGIYGGGKKLFRGYGGRRSSNSYYQSGTYPGVVGTYGPGGAKKSPYYIGDESGLGRGYLGGGRRNSHLPGFGELGGGRYDKIVYRSRPSSNYGPGGGSRNSRLPGFGELGGGRYNKIKYRSRPSSNYGPGGGSRNSRLPGFGELGGGRYDKIVYRSRPSSYYGPGGRLGYYRGGGSRYYGGGGSRYYGGGGSRYYGGGGSRYYGGGGSRYYGGGGSRYNGGRGGRTTITGQPRFTLFRDRTHGGK